MYVYACICMYINVYVLISMYIYMYMHVSDSISELEPVLRESQALAGTSGAELTPAMLQPIPWNPLIPTISLPPAAIGIATRPTKHQGAWPTVCDAAFGAAQCLLALFRWSLPRVGQHYAPCAWPGTATLGSPWWTLLGLLPPDCLSHTFSA